MNNKNWWNGNNLPSPSMRQNTPYDLMRHFSPSSCTSAKLLPQNYKLEERDKILEQRLTNLNMDKNDQLEILSSMEERTKMLEMTGQDPPSVSEIEQRLARLRGLPVEDTRYPRFTVVNGNKTEESVEKLIKRAKDEARLEKSWDCSEKSKVEHDVDPEKFLKFRKSDVSILDELNEEILTSDVDMDLMGQDTIRNLKQIQRTMKLAKQRSIEAVKQTCISTDNHAVDDEIEKLIKLANQSNMKSEKITRELSKFWETGLNYETSSKSSSKSEDLDDEDEIDCELHRVILEAEEAENDAMQAVKESKKNNKKSGILSRIFRPR